MREEHLVQEFIAEAQEQLLHVEPQLLQLEQEPDNIALIQDIFVATHAIKGTAAYVGLAHISEFTHLVESVLDRLRQQELHVSSDVVDTLLQGIDSLQRLIRHVASGQPPPDTSISEQTLSQLVGQSPGASPDDATKGKDIDSTSEGDLPVNELQFLEPEDLEIFIDIAGQQLESMRISYERLIQPRQNDADNGPASSAAVLVQAFRTIQSLGMTLESPSLSADISGHASVFAPLTRPDSLTEQELGQLFQALEQLEHTITTLSDWNRQSSEHVQPSQILPEASYGHEVLADSHTLRVSTERIDALLTLVGELVATRARIVTIEQATDRLYNDVRTGTDAFLSPVPSSRKTTVRVLKKLKEHLGEATADLGRLANQLQEGAMRVRMTPISQVVGRFPRMVRDLSRQFGKEIRIDIEGADTEIDKSVMDIIADPLIHLLRNAIDHGIEPPDEREAQGKVPQGHILLSASHQGNMVVIRFHDDGRGVDADVVKQKAIERHVLTPDEAAIMMEKEVLACIFRTGFSTLDRVSSLSGRGVGLHLVKRYLERVNGTIEFDTIPGKGSVFTLKFPLTLAIIPALLVSIHADIYAIPLAVVEEAIRIPEHEICTIESRRIVQRRGEPLNLVELTELLGELRIPTITAPRWSMLDDIELPVAEVEESFPDPFFDQIEQAVSAVVISAGNQELGLIIDRFLGESDIVITALEHDLISVEGMSGASIQPDGRIAFVLDAAALIRLANSKKQQKIAH